MGETHSKISYNQMFEEQMWQNLASLHYNPMTVLLNKLEKGEVLDRKERDLLAQYPFVLNLSSKKGIERLTKSKMKLNQILKLKK